MIGNATFGEESDRVNGGEAVVGCGVWVRASCGTLVGMPLCRAKIEYTHKAVAATWRCE